MATQSRCSFFEPVKPSFAPPESCTGSPTRPPVSFIERATPLIKLGINVIPLPEKEKSARLSKWQELATTEPAIICEWGKKYPRGNVGCVATPKVVVFLDVDDSAFKSRFTGDTGQPWEDTLTVESSPGHFHFYYEPEADLESLGNVAQCDTAENAFSLRVKNEYVVGPGSVHPKGFVYQTIVVAPIIRMPKPLLAWLRTQIKNKTVMAGGLVTKSPFQLPQEIEDGARDETLFKYACMCRRSGMNESEIYAALKTVNQTRCRPPLPDDVVLEKVKSAMKYSAGNKPNSSFSGARADYSNEVMGSSALITTTADKIEMKKIRWLWPEYFAEKLNTISGDPGEGKGLMTCYIISRVTTGGDWFTSKNLIPPSEVIILSNEDDYDDTLVPRLEAAGADRSKVHILNMVSVEYGIDKTRREREFGLDTDVNMLEDFLTKHPDVRLVVVDPVSNYLGRDTKMIDEKDVRRVLMPLKNLAEKMHVAVVAVMHLNKKSDQKHIYRVSGALGFIGVARMNWVCMKVPPGENGELNPDFEMQKIKGNIVKRDTSGLVYRIEDASVEIEGEKVTVPFTDFVGYAEKTLDQMNPNPESKRGRPAEVSPAVKEWLKLLLAEGPQEISRILQEGESRGYAERAIYRAATQLAVVKYTGGEAMLAGNGKSYKARMWRLPDNPSEDS